MAQTKTYTPEGFKALQDELDYLVNVRVEENKKEISTARAFGDLS
jgi:transcription elongation GreA/GreB family factor